MFLGWPSTIVKEFYKILVNGLLYPNLSTSFLELSVGFGMACFAIPLGLAMGRSKTLEYLLDPLVSALNAMPRIALMPLLILVFGLGLMSKIVLVFIGCFFPILVNVFQGMKNVDPLMVDMARVFGAKRWFMAREVFLPAILPFLLAGFRIAVSLGLIMVVVAEFLVGNIGVGYMIATEAGYYHASAVMAWVLIVGVLSILLTELIKYFENRMSYWK
jgi:ABC-type nitrate/sulfonate/bicarbonate transport system permease component